MKMKTLTKFARDVIAGDEVDYNGRIFSVDAIEHNKEAQVLGVRGLYTCIELVDSDGGEMSIAVSKNRKFDVIAA